MSPARIDSDKVVDDKFNDLNDSLSAILGYSQFLLKAPLSPEDKIHLHALCAEVKRGHVNLQEIQTMLSNGKQTSKSASFGER